MIRRCARVEWNALTCVVLAAAFARLVSIHCFYLYDDAFITFRYAANLVHGNGFVYTVGQRVQGTTSPLWGLILAVPEALGWGVELSSRLLGLLIELVIVVAGNVVLKRENLSKAALLFGFLFALDLYLAKTSVSGMESSLFLLGTVAATALALRGRQMLAAAITGLCVFLRPEALLFAVCLIGILWYDEKRFPLKAILLGAGIVLVGVGVQTWYYGDIIPQSVRAKMALPRGYEMLWTVVLFPKKDPLQALLTITALLSVPYSWKVSRLARIYTVWPVVLFASWTLTGAHLWMWYCVPLFFAKVLLTAIGAEGLLNSGRVSARFSRLLHPLLLLGVVVLAWTVLAVAVGPDRMDKNVYSRIRKWSALQDFRGQKAYGMDFGAFGFYTGLPILDEPGLVYPPSLSRYHTDPQAILLGEKPDWAFVTCYDGNIEMMRTPELLRLYEPVIRFSVDGDTNPKPELKDVSPVWKRDFILFKLKPI